MKMKIDMRNLSEVEKYKYVENKINNFVDKLNLTFQNNYTIF